MTFPRKDAKIYFTKDEFLMLHEALEHKINLAVALRDKIEGEIYTSFGFYSLPESAQKRKLPSSDELFQKIEQQTMKGEGK